MSLFSTVNAEISKNVLVKFGPNFIDFFKDIFKQHQLEADIVERENMVIISGELSTINYVYTLISTLTQQLNSPKNDVQESPNKLLVTTSNVTLNPLQCSQCLRNFRSLDYLKRHQRTHLTSRFKCNNIKKLKRVDQMNGTKDKFNKDDQTDTDSLHTESILCGFCDNLFEGKNKLKEHILSDHFNNDTTQIYEKDNDANITVKNEIVDASNEQLNMCGGIKLSNDAYVNKDTPSSSLSCRYCPYAGRTRSVVRDHEHRNHIQFNKKFACSICGKAFGYKKDLTRHMLSHAERKHSCPVCGKKYRHSYQMIAHSKTHDSSYVASRLNCEYCPKTFSVKSALMTHVKSQHLGQQTSYLCQTCGKQFTQKRTYHQHINVHLGIKPYICDVCGVPFSYQKSLKDHMLMHGEVRKYECDVCHKKFKQSSGLLIHRKIHKETRDHICSYCERGFTQKTSLVRHERIHLGTKPYSCNLCHQMFRDVSVIRRHLIMVHKCSSGTWKNDMSRLPPVDVNKYFVEPQTVERANIGILLLNNATMPVDLLC